MIRDAQSKMNFANRGLRLGFVICVVFVNKSSQKNTEEALGKIWN